MPDYFDKEPLQQTKKSYAIDKDLERIVPKDEESISIESKPDVPLQDDGMDIETIEMQNKIAMQNRYADLAIELNFDPVEYIDMNDANDKEFGTLNPIVPLMFSEDPQVIDVVKIALRNQKNGMYFDAGMNPLQRGILNGERIELGAPIETASTFKKAMTAAANNALLSSINPVFGLINSANRMLNHEIGINWNLNDGLVNLKNKNGEPLLVPKIQDKGGY
tara:strand:+ start:118 stop:780 length:663 start_codon:yes stop_codon:yes gene_type:complete